MHTFDRDRVKTAENSNISKQNGVSCLCVLQEGRANPSDAEPHPQKVSGSKAPTVTRSVGLQREPNAQPQHRTRRIVAHCQRMVCILFLFRRY